MYKTIDNIRQHFRFAIIFLALPLLFYGCSSKNPLIDDPNYVPPAKTDSSAQESDPTPATPPVPVTQPESSPKKALDDPLNTPPPTGFNRIVNIFRPYKIDIQQGNFISHEMLARVKHEMTKEQVRFILGTPLLVDIFHSERWDYMFHMRKPSGQITTSKVTIFFVDNRVHEIYHDDLPSETDYLSRIAGERPNSSATKPSTEKTVPPPE